MLVWRYHQVLSGFLANDLLSQVSSQSRLSANDKDDNEIKTEALHTSLDIYLTVDEGCAISHPLK